MMLFKYIKYAKYFIRKINSEMPSTLYQLRKRGLKFTLNYSTEGDAKLIVKPCIEDRSDLVPVNDRHYEYAYTIEKFKQYSITDKDILDVGSTGSVLPTILASLGNHVVCLDVREWGIKWPNLTFIKGDVLESDLLPFEAFDVITCISTVEHFGLGRYGDKEDVDADIKGIAKIKRYLKPRGLMILTVPFGIGAIAFPAHRIYNKSRFQKLISGFRILDRKFFGPIDHPKIYRPCTEKETYSVDPRRGYAIICSLLQKEE